MQKLTNIPVRFDIRELSEKLRIDMDGPDAKSFRDLVKSAGLIANPKAAFDVKFVGDRTGDSVWIEDVRFDSRVLRANLDKIERVFPYVATCGTELDSIRVPEKDMLMQYWRDELKSAALAAAKNHLFEYLKQNYALPGITGMSPGSGDRNVWPIEQQRLLFSLLGDTEKAIGVHLTDSCLMIPNKSISGIAFPSETTFETCRLCSRPDCPGRKAPCDETLYRKLCFHTTSDSL